MDQNKAMEKVVETVMSVLAEKGLLKAAPAAKAPEAPAQPRALQAPMALPKSPVTTGTAGKIFSGAPGAWGAFPKAAVWSEKTSVPAKPKAVSSALRISSMIDHTLLRPDATEDDVRKLCAEAKRFNFAAVCVNPVYVPLCSRLLKESAVKVCAVVGFPFGATSPSVKALEAGEAAARGADEIDMVVNVGALKSNEDRQVLADIAAVREASRGKILKVILETCLLTRAEKQRACKIAKEAGADFVKTSTGFSKGGATIEDVQLMKEAVGGALQVKASGGIKTLAFARELARAGADRIGTSASVSIALEEARQNGF